MLDLLRDFSVLDVILVLAVSLCAGMMLRHWHALAWMVFAALLADFALPYVYNLVTGVGWELSWALASRRYVFDEGGMLIWRTAAYFALIGLIFLGKCAWLRR